MNFIKCFLISFLMLFLLAGVSSAESPNVKADQVYLDFGTGTWVAEGNVIITYKDYEFTGEKAQYYPSNSVLDLFNGKLVGKDVNFLSKKVILKKTDNGTYVDAFNVTDGIYKQYSFACNELTSLNNIVTLIGDASIGSKVSKMTGDKFIINTKTGKIEGTNIKSSDTSNSLKKDANSPTDSATNVGQ